MNDHSSDWLIVETLGVDQEVPASVICEGPLTRDFTSLVRKVGRHPRPIAAAMLRAVDDVVASGRSVEHVIRPASGLPAVPRGAGTVSCVRAVPILSRDGSVFGVQLWTGDRDAVPAPRTVGTFEYDFRTQTARQSVELERDVLAMEDAPAAARTLPDIWKYFSDFPAHDEYMTFAKDVRDELTDPAQPYSAEIQQRGPDGLERRVLMAVRASRRDDRPIIAGLVHDISDSVRLFSTFGRELARTAAQLAISDDDAIGHVDLYTAVILEWIRRPVGALSRWERELPKIRSEDHREYLRAHDRLRDGSARRIELRLSIRFTEHTNWTPVDIVLTAVGVSDPARGAVVSQALLQVRPADPDAPDL